MKPFIPSLRFNKCFVVETCCSSGEQVNFPSPPLRMCHSPVEQKWNSTSAIIEQQGAKEVFELERRNESGGVGEKVRGG